MNDENMIGEHLRMVAEATNRFTQTFESRKTTANEDAAFGEYVTSQLAGLPENIKDDAMLQITQVLMEAKRRKRNHL